MRAWAQEGIIAWSVADTKNICTLYLMPGIDLIPPLEHVLRGTSSQNGYYVEFQMKTQTKRNFADSVEFIGFTIIDSLC